MQKLVNQKDVLPLVLFFFNDTATTEIYTLSLHDALPISLAGRPRHLVHETLHIDGVLVGVDAAPGADRHVRSEEHTSELQSRLHLVCRLLLEKKKKTNKQKNTKKKKQHNNNT